MVWESGDAAAQGISTTQATISLVIVIVGAGIMALPMLPKQGGINAVFLLTIFAAVAVSEAAGSFYKANWAWNRTQKTQLRTFEDFGVAALGKPGGIIVRCVQIGWYMGACSGFIVLMANMLHGLFGISYLVCVGTLAPLLWFLCMLRNLTAVAKLVPVAVIGALGSAVLIIVSSTKAQHVWMSWSDEDIEKVHSFGIQGFLPLGSVTATLLGAYSVMGSVPPILNEMKKPKGFPTAIKFAIIAAATIYLCVIAFGYWGFGNFIQADIRRSMARFPANATEAFGVPASHWTGESDRLLPAVMSCCVLTNLLISYPLCMMSIFVSIQGLWCAMAACQPGQFRNYMMRSTFVLVTVLIAMAVPNFGVLFAVFASIGGPVQGLFLPILFGALIRKKIGAKGSSPLRWFFHAVILIFGLFGISFGLVDSLGNLLECFGT
uniref:Amino acid transporter transmembrane domain-containing protein n=1 Tax=Zooxanthella nutricula TaxID=1333877 RepID=A0A7S2IU93_9DINO